MNLLKTITFVAFISALSISNTCWGNNMTTPSNTTEQHPFWGVVDSLLDNTPLKKDEILKILTTDTSKPSLSGSKDYFNYHFDASDRVYGVKIDGGTLRINNDKSFLSLDLDVPLNPEDKSLCVDVREGITRYPGFKQIGFHNAGDYFFEDYEKVFPWGTFGISVMTGNCVSFIYIKEDGIDGEPLFRRTVRFND